MKWRVSKQDSGVRLLQFLKENCKEAPSVKALKRAVDHKLCTVNGQIQTFSSYQLQEKDLVALSPAAFEKKEPLESTVLYEDADLLLIHKPAGRLSDLKDLKQKGCHLVHRLDKETSGVLILAKTIKAKEQMLELFKERLIRKLYLAVVDGVIEKEEGVVDNYLGKKSGYEGQTVYGAVPSSRGLRAITHWKCLSRGKTASLLCCEPRTGRTHQLRVHLSEMGHPILGDRQYAKKFRSSFHPSRNLLHAYRLTFKHPRTGKLLKVVAPIPLDFKEALDALKLSV
jgi:23S rRNA pseudouridine955/2504/2580 synthase